MTEFRNAVLYQLQSTAYTKGLPTLPPPAAYEGRFLKAFDDMATRWTAINALSGVPNFTAPLLLLSGYTLANFNTELTDLRAAFAAVTAASDALDVALATRDTIFTPIYAHLKEYILAVKAKFPATNSLVMTLPKLTLAGNHHAEARHPQWRVLQRMGSREIHHYHVAIVKRFTPASNLPPTSSPDDQMRYSPKQPPNSAADEDHQYTHQHARRSRPSRLQPRPQPISATPPASASSPETPPPTKKAQNAFKVDPPVVVI